MDASPAGIRFRLERENEIILLCKSSGKHFRKDLRERSLLSPPVFFYRWHTGGLLSEGNNGCGNACGNNNRDRNRQKSRLWRNPSHNALSGFTSVTPSHPQGGRQPKGASPLDPPVFNFFQCSHMAKFHGPNGGQTVRMRRIRRILRRARVGRPRAPVVPSLSNTNPHRFSTEPKIIPV